MADRSGVMERILSYLIVPDGFPIWARYSLTTIAVVAVFALRSLLTDDPNQLRFLFLFPTIILAGIVFNRGNAIWATIVGTIGVTYYLMPPIESFGVQNEIDAISLGLFVFLGLTMSALIEALHLGYKEGQEQRKQLASFARDHDLILQEIAHGPRMIFRPFWPCSACRLRKIQARGPGCLRRVTVSKF